MYGDSSVLLDLANIQGGELNADFQEHYKELVGSLKKGESGKITIEIKINRPPEMDTMVSLETSIKSQKPKRTRLGYGRLAADENGQVALKVDAPRPKIQTVSLFAASGNKE